jgi:hypothetical protein
MVHNPDFVGVHVYSVEAFGAPNDPVFEPIRKLHCSVDLSQPATVHATLAHSASHIAYLRQERDSWIQAIAHKSAALQLINAALNDPVKAISDETFCGVGRLIVYEVQP